MVYTYGTVFHVNPLEVYNTPASLVREMLAIHGEVKRIESEEMNKAYKKR
jgi:hypothetical protein